jgi:hypothetical protein
MTTKERLRGRTGRLRLDHALLVAAAAVMTVGSAMSWIRGSTRMNGYVDWSGLHDTGDGAILITIGLLLVAWVRWRGILEETEPRSRWVPFVLGITAGLIWVIALRKALYLAWFDLAVGARPQLGLFVAGIGTLLATAGGWLASQTRAAGDG